MDKLVCLICPNSCEWFQNEQGEFVGLKCKRGIAFASQELKRPLRYITTTLRYENPEGEYEMIPVRSKNEIPLDQIKALATHIKKVVLTQKPTLNELINLKNFTDFDLDLIITGE